MFLEFVLLGIINRFNGKGIQYFFQHRNRCEFLFWKGATMDLKKKHLFPKVSFFDFMCFFLYGCGGWVAISIDFLQADDWSFRSLCFVACCLSPGLTRVRCKMAPMSKAEQSRFWISKKERIETLKQTPRCHWCKCHFRYTHWWKPMGFLHVYLVNEFDTHGYWLHHLSFCEKSVSQVLFMNLTLWLLKKAAKNPWYWMIINMHVLYLYNSIYIYFIFTYHVLRFIDI